MSGRSGASTFLPYLLALGLSQCTNNLCRAEVTPVPSALTLVNTESQQPPATQIRLLTIKTIVSTQVSTVSHTVMLYPTCTTTAADVSACPAGDPLPAHLTSAPPRTVPATLTPHEPGLREDHSTTSNIMEVVLPSCDCGGEGRPNSRNPRFLSDEGVITLKTTTIRTVDKIFTATASTTVSLTYNGCVPHDAVSTTPCLPPTTTSSSITTS